MEKKKAVKKIFDRFFDKDLIDAINQSASFFEFEEDEVLIDYGQYIKSIPLLLDGAIKILREDPDMGDLLLYYLEKGDSCALSMACCMGHTRSEIRAITETKTTVAMIPTDTMEEWMQKYPSWRFFVLNSYHKRFNELLMAVDNIAFNNMEQRLETYLLETTRVNNTHTLNKTHREIANELNTSRVVISRLLKKLENENKIQLNRNSITLF
ncbi:MAG TPA: Crp/Fnr family transcriptional regulator [Sphingobacterium sp.]|nr:Crp/Fnr family transcriptional regulator [Sphingobacterium sp.]